MCTILSSDFQVTKSCNAFYISYNVAMGGRWGCLAGWARWVQWEMSQLKLTWWTFFFFFSCVGTLAPPAPWTLPYLSKKNRILLRILLVIEFYFLFTCGCMLSITVLELWCIFRGRYFHLYIIPSITVTELWCFFSERGISIICKFFDQALF